MAEERRVVAAATTTTNMSAIPSVEHHLSISFAQNTQPSSSLDQDEVNDTITMNVNHLPDVLLLDIFSYLTVEDVILGARQCCQRWYALSHDVELWRHLKFDPDLASRLVDGAFLSLLPEIKDCVETMVFESCYLLMDNSLVHQDIVCGKLTSLEFNLSNISSNGLGKLLVKYPNLERLKVRNCKFLNFAGLISALKSARRLKSLEFDDCSCLGDASSMNKALLDVFEAMATLKHLDMVVEELDDATLRSILKRCPELETLNISSCTHITNNAFIRPGMKIPNCLKRLSLSYTAITDYSVEHIAKSCPELRVICIKGCRYVTDIGIGHLARHCHQLQRLVVNEFNHEGSSNITNIGLRALADGCHDLRYLVMNYCPGVTDIGITAIARGCRELRHISAAGCLSITDAAVRSLAAHSKYLLVVVFSECVQLTAESINLLVGSCERLHTLELETCHYLSQLNFGQSVDQQSLAMMPSSHGDQGTDVDFPIVEVGPALHPSIESDTHSFASRADGSGQEHSDSSSDLPVGTRPLYPNELNEKLLSPDSKKSNLPTGPPQMISKIDELDSSAVERGVEAELPRDTKPELTHHKESDTDSSLLHRIEANDEPAQYPLHNILPTSPTPRRFASLFVLKLTLCSKIANDSVKQIAKHCSDLRELSLRGCYLITDTAVEVIAETCEYLQVLDISGGSAFQTSKLTDRSLDAVGKYCKLLQKLFIQKNNRISVDGINLVAKECPKLKIIGFSVGAPSQITLEAVLMMLRRIPDQCIKCTNTPLESRNPGARGNLTLEIFPRPRAMSPM